ncbi:hypothetical protein ES705_32493 [subsurface metagenome]
MIKKILLIPLALLLALSLVAIGCPTPPTTTTPTTPTTPSATTTPVFELKLQSHLAGVELERWTGFFCPLVEKLTNGTVKITPYAGGTLIPSKEILDAVGSRTVDMGASAGGYWTGVIPVDELTAGLPFCFGSLNEARFFMWHRGFVDILREEYAKHNAYFIPFECYGVGLMTNKPIEQVSDLKGMKLRAYGAMAEWLDQCEAATVYIPGGELYTGLATGVVSGAHWADAGPMYEMKFQEVLKYYMLPEPIQGAWNNIYVNMDLWNEFTPEQRNAIEVAAVASGAMTQNHTRLIYERALCSMVEDWDVKATVLSEEEQAKAKELAMKAWDKIAQKDPRNAEVIAMIKDFLKEEEVIAELIFPYPW